MSRLISPAVVVFLVASCSVFGATATPSIVGGTTELAIDGVSCGKVFSVEGGDPRTSVVVENPVGAALLKKHIAGVTYAPITVEVAFPPAQPILDWIGDLCANRQTRKTLLLTEYNVNGQVTGTPLQAINALLTEVRFPAFDAASKDAARLTLVFTPESTQAATAVAATSTSAATSKAATMSNFRIQIGTLPASRVSRIESITIKQPVAGNIVGSTRQSVQTVGTTEFSNLVLTINSIDIADWNTWRDNFVVKGTSDDASEKSGSLEMLAADMTTTLLTLQFSHVGIIRASSLRATSSDAIPKFQAELYCESMAIGTAPAKPLTLLPVAPSTATMAAPAPTTTAVSSATAPSSGGSVKAGADAPSGGAAQTAARDESSTIASTSTTSAISDASGGGAAAQTTATPAVTTASRTLPTSLAAGPVPVSGVAPVAAAPLPVSTTASTPVVTNSADQGAHDPANFPRPDGSVRESYSSVRQKTYLQEIVAYSSKDTLDAIEEFYTKSLTSAGWELNRRFENNSGVGNAHQIIINWTNTLRSVAVTLTEVKGGGAEIGVNLTTTFAP